MFQMTNIVVIDASKLLRNLPYETFKVKKSCLSRYTLSSMLGIMLNIMLVTMLNMP